MKSIILLLTGLLLIGCGVKENSPEDIQKSEDLMTTESLGKHIGVLASDEFQGRQPSTDGEELTINYLKDEFEKLGLKPGNGNSFFQEVPLVEIVTEANPVMIAEGKGKKVSFQLANEYVATTRHVVDEVKIENAELVFAGFGIVAPEYGWNDYEDIDVKGKVVVVLINDPGFFLQQPDFFTGKAMTYYGRWTYKYEEAARQGAEGILIIHDDAPASYPWDVVRNGWTGSQFNLVAEDKNFSKCKLEGWINTPKAKELFTAAGLNYEQQLASALTKDFKAVNLGININLLLKNSIKESVSNNVLALIPGTERKDEYIIYTAHWDHFGVDENLPGDDKIYNGAIDNSTGTASLLELAKAFMNLPAKPKRSILFLAVTAEEQGLLGSAYYSENPIYPLNKTVATINLDAIFPFGSTSDITVVGYGLSELDNYVLKAAKNWDMDVAGDPAPERGTYFRSDHFSFAKKGVPSLYVKNGEAHIEKGTAWYKEQVANYTKNHYHKPSDNYEPENWDLNGIVDILKLVYRIGYDLTNESTFPNWNENSEFRAIRDASMKN